MSGTLFTQDVMDGRPVISKLDVSDLDAGKHEFWFRPSTTGTGQSWHLPVWVLKGSQPGPRLVITAGVHGDELNGVLTAQALMRELEGKDVSGTIVIVPEMNASGIINHIRHFIPSDPDASTTDLNRVFPGKNNGGSAERYIHAVWHNLLLGNADLAVDLHTQTKGAVYPLFIFADYRIPQTVKMARLVNPDCIMDDPGEAGVLETVWNEHQVPCITIEIGAGKVMQLDLVDRALRGVMNILVSEGLVEGKISTSEITCFEGKIQTSIRAEVGGYSIPLVALGDQVQPGDQVAVQYDSFGHELKRYLSPVAGQVVSINQDPLREPGTLLVRVLHD